MTPKDKLHSIAQTLASHPFVVPKLLQNPHFQTLFARLVPSFTIPNLKPERKYIHLPDGSQLAADCFFQKERDKHATVVVLGGFEGYIGKEVSRFAKGIGDKAYHFGLNVILLKQRGEGDTIHLTKSLFTTYVGLNDVKIALEEFVHWGLKKMYLVGVSYGGYLSLLTIGRLGEKAKKYILGTVAVSPHVNMLDSWKHVEKHSFYDWWLLYAYKNVVRRRAKLDNPGTWDIKELNNIKTKREFMETYMHTFGYPKKDITLQEYNEKI